MRTFREQVNRNKSELIVNEGQIRSVRVRSNCIVEKKTENESAQRCILILFSLTVDLSRGRLKYPLILSQSRGFYGNVCGLPSDILQTN